MCFASFFWKQCDYFWNWKNISLAKEEALAKALLDRGTGERVIAQKLKENEEK